MSRPLIAPLDWSRTIHFLGDMHFSIANMDTARKNKLLLDIQSLPSPAAHVQVGDLVNENTGTNNNDAAADAEAVAWMAQLPVQPWYGAIGNHDIYGNNRTVAAAVAALGLAGQNYIHDFSFARLIVIGPDQMVSANTSRISLSQTTLDFLDAQLSGTTKPCVIVCHAPLKTTHIVSQAGDLDSTTTDFWVTKDGGTVDTDVRTILGNHTNAKAWLSGHIHMELAYTLSPLTDIVKKETVGSRTIAAIHCPAPAYNGLSSTNAYGEMFSAYVTVLSDRVQVRYRNHSGRCWEAPYEGLTPTISPRTVLEVTYA